MKLALESCHISLVKVLDRWDHKVFEAPLPSDIPLVLIQCSDYIRKYGMRVKHIFRAPGKRDLVENIIHLFDNAQKGTTVDLKAALGDPTDETCNVIASVIKHYYRCLPTPLVHPRIFDRFVS